MANWTQKDLQDKKIAMVDGVYRKLEVGKGRKKVPLTPLNKPMPQDTPKVSRTVMNATKVEINGIKFASKLEAYLYGALTNAGIEFEYQKVYELQPKFKYLGETIRPIRIIVDFKLKDRNIILDSKGWSTTISTLKYKLLKYLFFKVGDEPEIFMPSCKSEIDFLINKLKYDKI